MPLHGSQARNIKERLSTLRTVWIFFDKCFQLGAGGIHERLIAGRTFFECQRQQCAQTLKREEFIAAGLGLEFVDLLQCQVVVTFAAQTTDELELNVRRFLGLALVERTKGRHYQKNEANTFHGCCFPLGDEFTIKPAWMRSRETHPCR